MRPDGMGHENAKHIYRHEEEEPSMPMQGHLDHGMGCNEFKGEAMGIAYGQAGEKGCASDSKKIRSQFKDYHWEGASGMQN